MPKGQIEHANINVTNPDRSAALFKELCGWHERWRGASRMGGNVIHVGNEAGYLALWTNEAVVGGFGKGQPLNHIGIVVDDLDMAEEVVVAHGLEPTERDTYEPGERFYFFDWDGIEFEVVSYE